MKDKCCFKPLPGGGKLYVPPEPGQRRYPCPDCHHCNFCSEDRCQLCRGKENRTPDTEHRKEGIPNSEFRSPEMEKIELRTQNTELETGEVEKKESNV